MKAGNGSRCTDTSRPLRAPLAAATSGASWRCSPVEHGAAAPIPMRCGRPRASVEREGVLLVHHQHTSPRRGAVQLAPTEQRPVAVIAVVAASDGHANAWPTAARRGVGARTSSIRAAPPIWCMKWNRTPRNPCVANLRNAASGTSTATSATPRQRPAPALSARHRAPPESARPCCKRPRWPPVPPPRWRRSGFTAGAIPDPSAACPESPWQARPYGGPVAPDGGPGFAAAVLGRPQPRCEMVGPVCHRPQSAPRRRHCGDPTAHRSARTGPAAPPPALPRRAPKKEARPASAPGPGRRAPRRRARRAAWLGLRARTGAAPKKPRWRRLRPTAPESPDGRPMGCAGRAGCANWSPCGDYDSGACPPARRSSAVNHFLPLALRGARRGLARGFTLLELMVVLVIIGVLAALIVPNLLDRADDARMTAARTDITNLMQALKLYRLDNQRYPTAEQGLQALLVKPGAGPMPNNWKPYLDQLPNDPRGRPYQYLNPGIKGEVDVMSFGADGQSGGEGKDADIGSWQ